MNYGMPYKGSKNKIAKWIVESLPAAEWFVDLFGGGGAVTHAAMLSGKWRRFIYNDFDSNIVRGFDMAVHGGFANEKRWICREDFERLKDTDPYVSMCFSFGNNCADYCYSKEVEPWKRALHYARMFGDLSEFEKFGIKTDTMRTSVSLRADIQAHKDEYKAAYIRWYMKNVLCSDMEYRLKKEELERNIKEESERLRAYLVNARNAAGLTSSAVDKYLGTNGMSGHYFGRSQWEFPTRENYIKMQEIMPALDRDFDEVVGLSTLWQSLESLESLQSLESLESLERLQSLQSLEIFNRSYEDVKIPKNATVYCDIPYRGTDEYNIKFDHNKFYDWVRRQKQQIFISEYNMPTGFFVVDERVKTVNLSAVGKQYAVEKIYSNKYIEVLKFEQMSFFDVI